MRSSNFQGAGIAKRLGSFWSQFHTTVPPMEMMGASPGATSM